MAVDVAVGTVVSLRAIAIAAAQCIVMVLFVGGWLGVCVCVCVCVCGGEWVCYHDNSNVRASILTKLGLLVKVVIISR